MSKQYGLIVPSKTKPLGKSDVIIKRPSIFDEDSDSEEEVRKTKKPTGISKSLKRQDRMLQNKALEEDPTVYQYDEVYDEMDKKRKFTKLSNKDVEKKPKYITHLLATAERRKKENERRIEREVQKEREAEGDMYKDKESFVTSAYKKKLEERRLLDEQEKREEYLESIGNVEKQANLDGFYRHLYAQKVEYEDIKQEADEDNTSDNKNIVNDGNVRPDKAEESENESTSCSQKQQKNERTYRKRKSSASESDSKQEHNSEDHSVRLTKKSSIQNRKYRKMKASDSDNSTDAVEYIKKEHLPSNLDADSDFSIDSSDSEEGEKNEATKPKQKLGGHAAEVHQEPKTDTEKEKSETQTEAVEQEKESKEKDDTKNDVESKEPPPPKKPKIDIWKKRTVGEVYDAALQRYFMRKAARESQIVI